LVATYDHFDNGEALWHPAGIELNPDGSLYLSEEMDRNTLFKIRLPAPAQ
jgi:hypothetical protein